MHQKQDVLRIRADGRVGACESVSMEMTSSNLAESATSIPFHKVSPESLDLVIDCEACHPAASKQAFWLCSW